MDKEEIVIAITKAEGEIKAANKRVDDTNERVEKLEGIINECTAFIKKTVIRTVTFLLFMGLSGLIFGWHISSEMGKKLLDWVSK